MFPVNREAMQEYQYCSSIIVKMRSYTKQTSAMERDCTFFMFGTTRPFGVAMATPILWEPTMTNDDTINCVYK